MKPRRADPRASQEGKDLAATLEKAEVVTKIYINIERRTPPTTFRSFGARLVPSFNYFQTAVCLFEDGYLTLPAVAEVAAELTDHSGYTPHRLANSLADIARRGHLRQSSCIAVREYLRARGLLPQRMRDGVSSSLWQRLQRWFRTRPAPAPRPPRPSTTRRWSPSGGRRARDRS
jgi:hypothetical protein